MKKLQCEILISASREQVWNAVTNPGKFKRWTRIFSETSYFEGGWNKGDAIRFLAVGPSGEIHGMVSEIADSVFPSFISIRHLGNISNGVEDTESETVKKWSPSFENYSLEMVGENQTRFSVDMDTTDEYYEMFLDLWIKALKELKATAEIER